MTDNSLLDLSSQELRKLPKNENSHIIKVLDMRKNCLQKLENVEQFTELNELIASHNQMMRMYTVAKLSKLVKLDLSNNHLMSIEGLRDLINLSSLNLSNNKIKIIEHLSTNVNLVHIDLSFNSISYITNLSHLLKLERLFLHSNNICHLTNCQHFLPVNLLTLTLANNNLNDLNEISQLCRLGLLREITLTGNSCLEGYTFNYRPFVVNWCPSVKIVDGYAVDDIENLKAEWLYSQGQGRKFHIGQHTALVRYLTETCPITSHALETEQERKLRLVLSKAQQYREQLHRTSTPNIKESGQESLMTRSLDPSVLKSTTQRLSTGSESCQGTPSSMSRSVHLPMTEVNCFVQSPPLPAASTMLPILDSLPSPLTPSIPKSRPIIGLQTPAGEESRAPTMEKLQMIKNKASQMNGIENKDLHQSAIVIQKMWRGYHTRNLNKNVTNIYQHVQMLRFNQYIKQMSKDLVDTKSTLEKEHKLVVLQMQAINELWKKVNSMDNRLGSENNGDSKCLTCSSLDTKVQQLQESMDHVLRCVSPSSQSVAETQTDITAVQTPVEGSCPNANAITRPNFLPLSKSCTNQVIKTANATAMSSDI
ncbi:centrosomal protein of 97 kDa [Acyrthosiphon pisum]|uniref:Centrosomal protein of 97 kDa n=1 Tax=Acyrthosiphon pisum TaxID=7029 RepID=A0A8R1W416_ACYPI|nr:centrosomal protein of 97 kDa [Acyrthosiphon pisum]|eukprot:XP_003241236.1 PREDICTED: centrosomal protein of 97 kDa [Acyrthosiphon pisum]